MPSVVTRNPYTGFFREHGLLITLLLLALLLFTRNITLGELHLNNDETRHAMTGVFFHDLVKDFPIKDPVGYTYAYYARYPALGIIHWPPFFYLVEALFYFIFGISSVSAKLAVVLFSLVMIVYWFRLISGIYDKITAFFSTLLLLTVQPIVLYSESVMLEIPALALTIGSIYYFHRYLQANKRWHLYLCVLTASLALLTKQTAFFILPLFFIYLVWQRKLRVLLRRESIAAISIGLILVTPHYAYAFKVHSTTIMSDIAKGTADAPGFLDIARYAYYLKALPGQVGLWILLFGVIFIFRTALKRDFSKHAIFFIWVLVCYVLFALITQKSDRHNIYYTPPLVLFAVCGINALTYRLKKMKISVVILLILSVWQLAYAYKYQRPFIKGYEEAAKYAVENLKQKIILFHGYLEGNFIFYVRKYDVHKDMIVLRSNKMLYTVNVFSDYGMLELAHDKKQILTLLNDYGIRYLIVESKDLENASIISHLRSLLSSKDFELIKEFPVSSNQARYNDMKLLVYEYKNYTPATKKELKIHLLTVGRELSIRLDDLLSH